LDQSAQHVLCMNVALLGINRGHLCSKISPVFLHSKSELLYNPKSLRSIFTIDYKSTMAANHIVFILGAGPGLVPPLLRSSPATATRSRLRLGVGVAPRSPEGFSPSKQTLPSQTRSQHCSMQSRPSSTPLLMSSSTMERHSRTLPMMTLFFRFQRRASHWI
jgi:hypothetical protein